MAACLTGIPKAGKATASEPFWHIQKPFWRATWQAALLSGSSPQDRVNVLPQDARQSLMQKSETNLAAYIS